MPPANPFLTLAAPRRHTITLTSPLNQLPRRRTNTDFATPTPRRRTSSYSDVPTSPPPHQNLLRHTNSTAAPSKMPTSPHQHQLHIPRHRANTTFVTPTLPLPCAAAQCPPAGPVLGATHAQPLNALPYGPVLAAAVLPLSALPKGPALAAFPLPSRSVPSQSGRCWRLPPTSLLPLMAIPQPMTPFQH